MTEDERKILKLNAKLDSSNENYTLLCRHLDKIADELNVNYYWCDSVIHNGNHYPLVCEEILRKIERLKQRRLMSGIANVVLTLLIVGVMFVHWFI